MEYGIKWQVKRVEKNKEKLEISANYWKVVFHVKINSKTVKFCELKKT